jgi:hypothetical protein
MRPDMTYKPRVQFAQKRSKKQSLPHTNEELIAVLELLTDITIAAKRKDLSSEERLRRIGLLLELAWRPADSIFQKLIELEGIKSDDSDISLIRNKWSKLPIDMDYRLRLVLLYSEFERNRNMLNLPST